MPQQGRDQPRRICLIDGLRGLAALAVVVDHLGGVWAPLIRRRGDRWYQLMHLHFQLAHGVDVFFVISGFVIAYSLRNAVVTPRFAGRFALRRSVRLDPPYWFAIALSICVAAALNRYGRTYRPLPSPSAVSAHLLYLQGLLGFPHISVVFWTLCMEVQFYLLLITILLASGLIARRLNWNAINFGARVTTAVYGFSLAAALLGVEPPAPTCRWFWPHWYKFLLGAVISLAWCRRVPRPTLYYAVGSLAVVASVRAACLSRGTVLDNLGLYTTLATGALLAYGSQGDGLYHWLRWKPLLFVGTISYSLYLCHYPLIDAGRELQMRVGGTSVAAAVVAYIVLMGVSLVAAWLLYNAIERPSLRLAAYLKSSAGSESEVRPTPAEMVHIAAVKTE